MGLASVAPSVRSAPTLSLARAPMVGGVSGHVQGSGASEAFANERDRRGRGIAVNVDPGDGHVTMHRVLLTGVLLDLIATTERLSAETMRHGASRCLPRGPGPKREASAWGGQRTFPGIAPAFELLQLQLLASYCIQQRPPSPGPRWDPASGPVRCPCVDRACVGTSAQSVESRRFVLPRSSPGLGMPDREVTCGDQRDATQSSGSSPPRAPPSLVAPAGARAVTVRLRLWTPSSDATETVRTRPPIVPIRGRPEDRPLP